MSKPIVLLFGLVTPVEASGEFARALARIEQEAVRAIGVRGFEVRLASEAQARPRAEDASPAGTDFAARLGVGRVLSLELTPDRSAVWVTHHLRGVAGAHDVRKVRCEGFPELACPGLVNGILAGLRPRTHLEVDLGVELRRLAPAVTQCVRREDRRPLAERILGEAEFDLALKPSGKVEVRAIVPSRVAQSRLGACLRGVFSSIDVGPYDGPPILLRVPIDF